MSNTSCQHEWQFVGWYSSTGLTNTKPDFGGGRFKAKCKECDEEKDFHDNVDCPICFKKMKVSGHDSSLDEITEYYRCPDNHWRSSTILLMIG